MAETKENLALLKSLITEIVADYYQLDDMKATDRSFTIKARQCGMLDVLKDLDEEHLALCEAHALFWDKIASGLDPRIRFRVTKALAWGDDHCEITCQA